jgi:pimeloyl-ACP methyl ester carboxylesterase
MYSFPFSDLWSRLQCPTLILLSTVSLSPGKDFIVPPDDARRMQQIIPGSTLVEFAYTNHYGILYSAPETTVEVTRNFLAKL